MKLQYFLRFRQVTNKVTNAPIEKFCLELSQNPKTMFKNVEGIITFYEDLHHCLPEETNTNWPSWWSNISLVPFFKEFNAQVESFFMLIADITNNFRKNFR